MAWALRPASPCSRWCRRAFPYSAITINGTKGGLVFDASRQSLYTANKSQQAVNRFTFNGSGWDLATAAVPDIDAVALAPDGATLVATSTSNGIVLLDPATLAVRGNYGPAPVRGDFLNGLQRLAITNDGRAYFQGGTVRATVPYFDLVRREFGELERDPDGYFYNGPWFSISGDGARLNIVQSDVLSDRMLYLDSADRVPRMNPAGIKYWYEAAQSLRGERFVEGTERVFDRDFDIVGNLALPDPYYYGRTPVAAPDGTRVYLMAYSADALHGGTDKPRVYVFDSSRRVAVGTALPLLGYFTLPDYPTCRTDTSYCDTRALGTIGPDGKTLFFLGSTTLIVAPIPAVLDQAQTAPAGLGAARKVQAVRLKR